jgi:hypothetical protein
MYEDTLEIILPGFLKFWGQDVVKFSKNSIDKLLNIITCGSVEDNIMIDPSSASYKIKLLFSNPKESKSVHYVTTTTKRGMFEIRIQNRYGKLDIKKKRMRLLDKFHSLSMYYKRLSMVTDDLCPSWYRFRICPDSNTKLEKVYEVEEYSGEQFMFEVLREAQKQRKHEVTEIGGMTTTYSAKQGSLPSYSYGFKLAKMVETLQKVTYDEITDVGKIRFDKGEFIGTTEIANFYESEKEYFHWLVDEVLPLIRKSTNNYDKDKIDDFIELCESIFNSYTFKESRKAHRMRLVPDKLDSINLRVYNKTEFVTDKSLKELEERLNQQIESIARDKYFKGIDKGLDANLLDKFELLKRDEEFIKTSEQLLEEAKATFREYKKSTPRKLGSSWGKDKWENEVRKKEPVAEVNHRSDYIRQITNEWGDATDADKTLPETDDKYEEIIDKKGIAITNIAPAKYTKEHIAAATYYFINFYMPVVKREELLESKILQHESDLDEVVNSLVHAFQNNYKDFETGHVQPEFLKDSNDLEKHYKSTAKKRKNESQKKLDEEEERRYLR